MMTIEEAYAEFDKIGCCSFATLDGNGGVETRIAHFFAADEDGIYLRTMTVKPFYRQLVAGGWVSVSGEYPTTRVTHNEQNLPFFEPGFTMRVSGKVRELSMDEVEAKALNDENFNVAVYDIKKYPETRVFVLYSGHGERYDYDYAMVNRDHKVQRERFAFGGDTFTEPGLVITGDCIGCGTCVDVCTFKAITEGEPYVIHGERCDECGNCFHSCPAGAIVTHAELAE